MVPPSGPGGAADASEASVSPPPPDPAGMSDADLVGGTLSGRRECFAELAMRYTDMVATFAYGRAGSRELAEEITQEAMVRAYEGLWSLKARRRFSSWLLGIARNVCSRALEERSRMLTVGSEPAAASAGRTESAPAGLSAADRQKILDEVGSLEEHYRIVFVLHHQVALPCGEIARRLGVAEGTVRSRLSRAYAILRTKLEGLRSGGAG